MAFTSQINEEIAFSDPDINGVVTFRCPQGEITFQFTWAVMARLQAVWEDQWIARAAAAIDSPVFDDLAVLAAAASGEPEQSFRDQVYPILPLTDAVAHAWSYAWNGGAPPEPEEEREGKTRAQVSLFGWRLRLPFVRD